MKTYNLDVIKKYNTDFNNKQFESNIFKIYKSNNNNNNNTNINNYNNNTNNNNIFKSGKIENY